MRPIQLTDIDAVVRVILPLAPPVRRRTAAQIVTQARTADLYRKRLGKLHPRHGSGSLMSAAVPYDKGRRSAYCDRAYLACLAVIVDVLGDQMS